MDDKIVCADCGKHLVWVEMLREERNKLRAERDKLKQHLHDIATSPYLSQSKHKAKQLTHDTPKGTP